ncbi:aldehyde dehydrogenase family protein [Amnibacterium kyonggiense]|uniref:Acyl-CoA reductase-like NAD-dependent aldehyde dehydrogenase n=1 Tax=Amnibacterium kyonggiense TaxID=595671 RepID=A0A4R7FGG1_9MICO|nr:aldehyde dehydrogenase family protein [Amnibacterium kyonggiense]TDS76050.1 acyl-CoA reductase-like NAD-dependent aldehyde dehydrogenase [Amnibacterium kyonggiense]
MPAGLSTRTIEILDPATGEPVGSLPVADEAEAAAAVRRAAAAFPAWAATPPGERGLRLRAAAQALAARADEVAAMNTRETGKSAADAAGGVEAAVNTLLQYAELGPLHRGKRLRGGWDAVDVATPQPRGVVLALTPWNDPVAVAAGLLGAAIVSGDTVVHKPSERSPHTGALVDAILAAELPEGVLVHVTGDGTTGAALADQPGLGAIAHVGSTATGRALALVGAAHDVHVIRENGGNDPLVIDAGVDPVWAAGQAALGSFANAGQICTAVERIYVHRAIAEPFLSALVAEADTWTRGSGQPLVDARMRDAVAAQVDQAVAAGAKALAGGSVPDGPGTHYPATVLADVPAGVQVLTEETFGPVAPVVVVDDFDEGLRLAAADVYGLAATVLTPDMAHAHRAAALLPVGTVKVNAVFGGAPGGSAQPRGASGSGYGYGPELLDEMTTTTVVHFGLPGGSR